MFIFTMVFLLLLLWSVALSFFAKNLAVTGGFALRPQRATQPAPQFNLQPIRKSVQIFAILILPTFLFTAQSVQAATQWGTYLTPFVANSMWNARPLSPVFGTFVIPASTYYPSVSTGAWSTGVFLSKATDGSMVVKASSGKPGVWDPDAETYRLSISIPRWPADTLPASGSDGHADIVDPISGIIHSFFQLKQENGQWVATQYAWSPLGGRGWGDPTHYFQGSRATGVPTSAGLMRKHEINDGQPIYRHALAMSLTFDGLTASPAYIFPATSADTSSNLNTGGIPEGALMMLPPSYNTATIANLALRKVADTLKVYGAYVVDRNYGTPFAIYVENGADFNLHNGGWDNAVAAELDRMRAALRQVVSTSGWHDGNGTWMTPQKNFNVLSMRGPWQLSYGSGSTAGYETWEQAMVFPTTATPALYSTTSSRGLSSVKWATLQAGTVLRLTALATGGAKLRLQVFDGAGVMMVDSGDLGHGESRQFVWPANYAGFQVLATSGIGQPSSVKADLKVIGL